MKFTFPPESRPLDGYTLKRGIARGGFGEVYYGLSDAGKEVAIKLLQQNLEVELRGIQHCLNLRHPHLVAIHDVKTDADNDHWVIMEYIAGETLENVLLKSPGPLPIDQIESWMRGIESGLAYLHDRGIVHRDVKPGNIFWDEGAIKLGDVGLSKFMTPSRRSAHTESVGTVYYMAPEVTYGKYGYEVDIYSCGVMLYEMLTGKLPFDGQSTGEILMKHLSEAPDLSLVPAAFRGVIAGALAKDPKQRTPTISLVLQQFEAARKGRSIPSPAGSSQFAQMPPHTATRPSGEQHPTPAGFPSNLAEPVPAGVLVADPELSSVRSPNPVTSEQPTFPPSESLHANVRIPVSQAPIRPQDAARREVRSESRKETPEFDWWFHRIVAFIILVWLCAGLLDRAGTDEASARVVLVMAVIWPLIFVCLRWAPVQGSGLSWLWKHVPADALETPWTGRWVASRIALMSMSALTLMGLQCSILQMKSESLFFTFLGTCYLSYYFFRSERASDENRAASQNSPIAEGSFVFSNWASYLIRGLRRWDETPLGFWGQRLFFYLWPQLMLFCVIKSMNGRHSEENLIFFVIVSLPFVLAMWVRNRPEMSPEFLRNWWSLPVVPNPEWVPEKGVESVSPTFTKSKVEAKFATVERPVAPPVVQRSKVRFAGIACTPDTVRNLPGRQRLSDLTTSMAWASAFTILFAVGTGFLSPLFGVPRSLHPDPGKLGLFTLTTLMATWLLLAVGKVTEGRSNVRRPRKLISLLTGIALGAFVWWLARVLMVDLTIGSHHDAFLESLGRQPLQIDNQPTLLSFMVFFGLLFALRRWWWHVDAFRPSVFRMSSVMLTVATGAALPLVFAFPWDWAVTWAAVISCVVQLSAVWTPPESRIV